MKLLSSDARNTTAFAISSGVPRLPSGTVLAIVLARCWPASEEPRSSFSPGVSVAPGLTVDANVAVLQVRCPRPCERTHGGLGGAVHTVRRESLAADDGRVQDDRGTIRQQRQRLLHREQDALYVDVEDRGVELLSDRPQGGMP